MDAMDGVAFEYGSERASKARLAKLVGTPGKLLLSLLVFLLLTGGATLLYLGVAVGWLAVGVSMLPLMLVEWYTHELKPLPPHKNSKTIDDVLSGDVLARLPKDPT